MRTRFLIIAVAGLASLGVIAAAMFAVFSSSHLVIADQENQTEYFTAPVEDVERIELEWVHSVEKEPWREVYRLQQADGNGEAEFVLTDVYLESYGAGVPASLPGTTVNTDGHIHASGINQHLPQLSWVHSHATEHTLTVVTEDGNHILRTEIPHQAFVEAVIR